jgi:hypothetical protein
MAVSLDTKVDLLLKKLSGLSKTDIGANKSPSNESIPSPSLNRGDTQWLNSYLIPSTASSTLGTVNGYFQNNRIQCTPDTTSQKINNVYPTWKTGLIDWIPPEFDSVNIINTYRVKVFYGNTGLTDPEAGGGTQIFADGSLGQGEWFFDYQSGILNFFGNTPIPAGMTSTHVIYVLGYRYVGPRGFNSVFQVDTPTMRGNVALPTLITLKGDIIVEQNVTIKKDLQIEGGDLTTNQSVFNLLNTTASTVNFAGAGTTVNIGATSGTTRVKNNLDVDGDINIDGGDLTVSTSTFNLANTTATTVNFAGAATNLVVGATTGTTRVRNDLDVDGDVNIDGGDLKTTASTFNLLPDTATTVNFAGDAVEVNIGSGDGYTNINNNLDVVGDVNIEGGDLTTTSSMFNLLPDTATTVNFAGAATNLVVGATSGSTTVRNDLDINGDVNIDGGDLTVSTSTFNLANTNATTVNFAGSADNINIGASTGYTNINNNLDIVGDVVIDGGDLIASTEEFNLLNTPTTKTVNFAGGADNINIGGTEGTTNINNNLDVVGDVQIDGGDLTVSTEEFNLANTTARTVNFAGEANTVSIGSSEGFTNVNNNLNVTADVYIDGGDLKASTEEFNLLNDTTTKVNFAGEATDIQIGSDQGDTNVNNNLTVDGVTNVQKELTVEGDTTVNSKLTVEGIVDVNNSLYVTGNTDLSESLTVQGSTSVQKELVVEGNTQMNRGLSVEGELKAGKLVDTVIDCGEY